MGVYLVTWDLNREKANYNAARAKFVTHLSRYEHIRDTDLDSVWFISASASANDIDRDLRTALDNNDRLFVTRLRKDEYQGWLDPDIWKWIDARI